MKRNSPAATAESPELPPPHPNRKKTRELPNFSDCHCCNRRINSTNPKNRLRTLTSEWRIILLCKICYSLVESSQYCSYCLSKISSSSLDDFWECKRCNRRIHRDCVSKFSFDPVNGDFSVCFDCWVPKLLENDFKSRVCYRAKKRVVKSGGDPDCLGSKAKSFEELANEADFMAQKKISVADEAKEKAFNRGMVARRAVEIATAALGVVSMDRGADRGSSVIEDDAQLAIQLHRAMNSSPRIARNSCLLNTHCVDVPEGNANVDGLGLGSEALIETSCSGRFANGGCDVDSGDMGSLLHPKQNGLCLTRVRQECGQEPGKKQDEKCNGGSGGCLKTYSRRGQRESQDGRCKQEPDCSLRMYSRRTSKVRRHNAEPDRCFKIYSRKPSAISFCKN